MFSFSCNLRWRKLFFFNYYIIVTLQLCEIVSFCIRLLRYRSVTFSYNTWTYVTLLLNTTFGVCLVFLIRMHKYIFAIKQIILKYLLHNYFHKIASHCALKTDQSGQKSPGLIGLTCVWQLSRLCDESEMPSFTGNTRTVTPSSSRSDACWSLDKRRKQNGGRRYYAWWKTSTIAPSGRFKGRSGAEKPLEEWTEKHAD